MFFALQVSAQQAFQQVALTEKNNGISFTVTREANVSQYRIEASDDNDNYEVLGTVAAKGNSVFERTYSYKLYGAGHKFYRVGRVEMNGSLRYSQVIMAPASNTTPRYEPAPGVPAGAVMAGR